MAALGLRADVLEWESSRHNALLQRPPSTERGGEDARGRLSVPDAPAAGALPGWHDKLQALPALRSALMPLDESDVTNWSKPFSLVKADFEPWLSYYSGYCSSRLFLEGGSTVARRLDFPVQALLGLRRIDPRILLEPPVQIDGPVQYFDPAHAPAAIRDPSLGQSLLRAAEAMHRSLLKRAVEMGRELGNQLHEALLGEGMENLIRAWEKLHGRKPSPHELHIMLTTGRVATVAPVAPVAATVRSHVQTTAEPEPAAKSLAGATFDPLPQPAAVDRGARVVPSRPAALAAAHAIAAVKEGGAQDDDADFEPDWVTLSGKKQREAQARSPFWYLLHVAGLSGAGLLVYLLLMQS